MDGMAHPTALIQVFAFAIAFAMLPATAFAKNWQPIDVGHNWAYSISQSNVVEIGGQVVNSDRKRGKIRRAVVREGRRSEIPVPVFVVEETRDWKGSEAEHYVTLTAERAGALLEYAVDTGEGLNFHANPLIQVPASIKGGMKWDVGSFSMNGLEVTMEGEILGVQNAKTKARTYERCLKVRYTGKLSGILEVPEGRLPVRGGSLEVTQWFAPDVGVVLAEESVSMAILTAQGLMEVTTTDNYTLERFQQNSSLPAKAQH